MSIKELMIYFRFAFLFLLVIALGLFVINQVLEYHYKAEFLKAPCKLCMELNPEVKTCLYNQQILYPDGRGGWTNDSNTIYYNLTGLNKLKDSMKND